MMSSFRQFQCFSGHYIGIGTVSRYNSSDALGERQDANNCSVLFEYFRFLWTGAHIDIDQTMTRLS